MPVLATLTVALHIQARKIKKLPLQADDEIIVAVLVRITLILA